MLDHFDSCIVGAGVVGLAIARKLAVSGKTVIVLEKAPWIGSEISSRNSEVIHAGIYYPTDSLKAKLCVEGKHLLYDYCEKNQIAHRKLGKLIVAASDAQNTQLEALKTKAENNGVHDLEWISRAQLQSWEPNVAGTAALLSPSTGIIDSHGLMSTLANEIESHDGLLCLKTEFERAEPTSSGFQVWVNSVGEPYQFTCEQFINAAGLGAQTVASNIAGMPKQEIPTLYYCKGCYFALSGKSPFNRLIYPMPEPNTTGLGVHATIDMAGQAKFGPDTQYIDEEDYTVEEEKRASFAIAIQKYFPGLNPEKLTPSYAGIRPKIQAEGEPAKDFIINHSAANRINLFGIESPGLTSSLAIADHVWNLLS